MSTDPRQRVTELLKRISRGDRKAVNELLPLVYSELRVVARARMAGEKPGITLQPTALVHEAYLRLIGNEELRWENRAHFFGAAAEAMRRILIERARRYARAKHGGGQQRVSLSVAEAKETEKAEEILAIDESLQRLEELDPAMSQVVKLRFFAGLTVEQTAQAMGTAPRTVDRHWAAARAWLHRDMSPGG